MKLFTPLTSIALAFILITLGPAVAAVSAVSAAAVIATRRAGALFK